MTFRQRGKEPTIYQKAKELAEDIQASCPDETPTRCAQLAWAILRAGTSIGRPFDAMYDTEENNVDGFRWWDPVETDCCRYVRDRYIRTDGESGEEFEVLVFGCRCNNGLAEWQRMSNCEQYAFDRYNEDPSLMTNLLYPEELRA